jgi:nucleoid DNA-binding protein
MEFFGRILLHLLQKNESVEVTGLGTFSSELLAASLQFASRTIVPSSLKIDFDARPTLAKSKTLENYLMSDLGLNEPLALNLIESFAKNAVHEISAFGRCEIPGLGVLLKDIEGHVFFKSENELSLLADSFGLPKLKVETIYSKQKLDSNNREVPVIPLHPFDDEIPEAREFEPKVPYRFRWLTAGAVVLATAISLSSIYFLNWQNQSGLAKNTTISIPQEANLVPLRTGGKDDEKGRVKESNQIVAPNPVSAPHLPKLEKAKSLYFVIAGSFRVKEKSTSLANDLKKKGFEATPLEVTPSGQYRVAMARFDEKEKAISFLKESQASFKEQLWVLTQE